MDKKQVKDLMVPIDQYAVVDQSATVYDAWLYAIQPSWLPHGDAYPPFMRKDVRRMMVFAPMINARSSW